MVKAPDAYSTWGLPVILPLGVIMTVNHIIPVVFHFWSTTVYLFLAA